MKCYLCDNPIEDNEVCCTLVIGYAPNANTQQPFRPQRLLGLVCQSCAEPQQPDGDYIQEVAETLTSHAICPKCDHKQQIPDRFKGKGIVCKKCNWGYTV